MITYPNTTITIEALVKRDDGYNDIYDPLTGVVAGMDPVEPVYFRVFNDTSYPACWMLSFNDGVTPHTRIYTVGTYYNLLQRDGKFEGSSKKLLGNISWPAGIAMKARIAPHTALLLMVWYDWVYPAPHGTEPRIIEGAPIVGAPITLDVRDSRIITPAMVTRPDFEPDRI